MLIISTQREIRCCSKKAFVAVIFPQIKGSLQIRKVITTICVNHLKSAGDHAQQQKSIRNRYFSRRSNGFCRSEKLLEQSALIISNQREIRRCSKKAFVAGIFPADQTDFADQESSYNNSLR